MKLHPRLHACTRSGQTLITNASNLEEDYREFRGSRSVMACYCPCPAVIHSATFSALVDEK